MKLTFGIIVLNGDFFLRQVLESIYPFAHRICIAEGAVGWWAQQGITRSSDRTNDILYSFPDPEKKLKITHGVYSEKDEQCKAWFANVPDDTDYVFCNDADEIHSAENILKLVDYLKHEQPTSVGFRSNSFFGGFERIIGGFEREHSFKRVLKYKKGCYYRTHRQPTLALNGKDIEGKDVLGTQLYNETGIDMWHGSYVSPRMVHDKINYYEQAVISKGNCIPNYFKDVWLAWVTGNELQRAEIEQKWKGVQEFMPHARGECFTLPYEGAHPPVVQKQLPQLREKFNAELKQFL